MSHDTFYVTTPIYYVNDKPHIGHAYTTVLADVLARGHRLLGEDTHFLTGTDEHGQKVANAAAKRGVECQAHCDETVVRFQELWEKLEVTNDDFIRTTEDRHRKVVQEILQDLYDRGEIYTREYEGWYSVYEERFFTEKDLVDGKDPIGGREVEWLKEMNYFFKMSQYQQWLIDYIEANPEFIQPDFRRNETLGFLRQPLDDLCISRPKSRLAWGIELPFDPDYVCYVWFDALVNYISAIGYRRDEEQFAHWWPVNYHLIGKDILTTHSVYWPCMLKAMGVQMPKTIFAHGWWLVGRNKMGKSLGNATDPMEMQRRYGTDAFRYYLMAEMTPGNDATFSEDSFIERYNQDLAGGIGNMLNRVAKIVVRNFDGSLPAPADLEAPDLELRDIALAAVPETEAAIEAIKPDRAIAAAMGVVRACNRYFEQTTPWHVAKAGDTERLGTILYCAAEALRIVSGLLFPVIPDKMGELRAFLGMGDRARQPDVSGLAEWGRLAPGSQVADPKGLFPRIEKPEEAAPAKPKKAKKKQQPEPEKIDFDTFGKVQLKTAKVLVAERVEGSNKLLRLEIDLGSEQRQIVAGIGKVYAPEDLVGKTIVVVANLKPAKLMGVESNGMLLAASAGKSYHVLTVDGEVPPGSSVG